MTTPPTRPIPPASVASSSGKASKALTAAASAAAIVLEASEVTMDSRAQELLATRESVISEARRKRKFKIWMQMSEGVSEDDDAEQARLMKEARLQAERELPFDPEITELRTAYNRVHAARTELTEAEGALAQIVEKLGVPTKKAKK